MSAFGTKQMLEKDR